MDNKQNDQRESNMDFEYPCEKPPNQATVSDSKLVLQQNGFAARINKNLIIFKYFYFLLYSAAGTTFPFLVRYFHQIGLSNGQVLVLSAVRPVVQLLFSPFWGILGDRYVSKKMLIQFSLLIWLLGTISIAFLEPTEQVCQFVTINQSKTSVINSTTMKTGFFRRRRSIINIVETPLTTESRVIEVTTESHIDKVGASGSGPNGDHDNEVDPMAFSGSGQESESKVSLGRPAPAVEFPELLPPPQTPGVKVKERNVLRGSQDKLNHIFVTGLFIVMVVEIFACPLIILIDAALLSKQNEENFSYGHQRVFGSLGYLIFFFIVNALLQNSLRPVCGEVYADFVICFCFFASLTIITLIGTVKLPTMTPAATCSGTRPFHRLKTIFYTRHFGTLLLNICFMGFTHSVLENYYNSIVMDPKVAYSSSVTVNFFRSIGEPLALFFSSMILNRAGVINVLFAIPVVTALNLFASSFITSLWHVIPLGILDGCTYGISWVACATYLIGSAPDDCTATVQGCFQGAYWGIGKGFRLLVGTSIMSLIGPSTSLRLFTILAFCIAISFTLGLKNLHFTEQNYYTTIVGKIEGLCEGQVKCEVVPPIRHGCDTRNELTTKTADIEKGEKKKEGARKDTRKAKYIIEDSKESIR